MIAGNVKTLYLTEALFPRFGLLLQAACITQNLETTRTFLMRKLQRLI